MSKGPWKDVAGKEIMARVKADDIKGETALLTIKRCFVQHIGRDSNLCIEVAEFPNKVIQCNKTQAAAIQALVGNGLLPDTFNETLEEFEGWDGLALPVFKKNNEYTDKQTGVITEAKKLYAVAPSQYDKAVATYPALGKTKPRTVRASAKKSSK